MDVFSPAPRNTRELVSLGDCITSTPKNWKELKHPVDVFTPTLRNKKKQEIPGDVFSPASRNKKKQEVRWACYKIKIEKQVQKKGAQMSESALSLFYFRRKM